MENLDDKYGIVALFDALGVKNKTIQESRKFLEVLNDIQKTLPPYLEQYGLPRVSRTDCLGSMMKREAENDKKTIYARV